MSSKFEAFSRAAKEVNDEVLLRSGRSSSQKDYVFTIVEDIRTKLDLSKNDVLLDVGCGTGLITSQLSKYVNIVYAVDNENMIGRFKEFHPDQAAKIIFFLGSFLSINLHLKVDKILCYSVIHYLKNKEEVYAFINEALSLLKPGGLVLFGDLPNVSHKERFLKTAFGKKFSETYRTQEKCDSFSENVVRFENIFANSGTCFANFDDSFLIELVATYRHRGYSAYILPQNGERNTFGYTREDILIKKYR